ncbi:hypothetical protein FQN50_006637 [Emmonsiellopsis sp. PD_5]|nr:hypothetical protein FQN50_006637 [Emmonsiellopsis sp. PD_5]
MANQADSTTTTTTTTTTTAAAAATMAKEKTNPAKNPPPNSVQDQCLEHSHGSTTRDAGTPAIDAVLQQHTKRRYQGEAAARTPAGSTSGAIKLPEISQGQRKQQVGNTETTEGSVPGPKLRLKGGGDNGRIRTRSRRLSRRERGCCIIL